VEEMQNLGGRKSYQAALVGSHLLGQLYLIDLGSLAFQGQAQIYASGHTDFHHPETNCF
jgi:hypothetical protein